MEIGKKKKKKIYLSPHKRQVQAIGHWIILLIVLVLGIVATGNNAIMIGTLSWFALVLMVSLAILEIVHKNRKALKAKLTVPEPSDQKEPEKLKAYAVEVIEDDRKKI